MKDNYEINLSVGDNSAEDVQRTINEIFKWGGLIISLVLGLLVGNLNEDKFNFGSFLIVWIAGSAITLLIWSTSMIMINISDNLRTIKHLLAQNNGIIENGKNTNPIVDTIENATINKEENTKKTNSQTSKTVNDNTVHTAPFKVGDDVIVLKSGVISTIKDIQGDDIYLNKGIFGGTFKVSASEIKHA